MKPQNYHTSLALLLIILCPVGVQAQVPFIKTVNKNAAGSQEVITIQGINFGTNASNIKVMFGSTTAVPQTISDQLLEVKVPSAALYDNLEIINTSTGLIGYSTQAFLPSFGGTGPFDPAKTAGQFDFASESGLYDLTVADFDGDGRSDIATANDNATDISVFLNTSTPGTASFTKSVLTPGVTTLHVTSGDLNGDGKPEIIVSEVNGSRLFVFKNNSTVGSLSFGSQIITIATAKVSQIRIADLDLDGKPELVVTDQSAGRAFVLPNQSSLALIQFGTPVTIATTGTSTDGIAVGDLNNDDFPEIVVCEFLTTSGKISIVKNQSSPNNLSFATPIDIQASTTVSNLRIGDLDRDSRPDLAATALLASSIMVFANQSTSSAIQMAAPVLIDANEKPWGIDFGDVDGDGKVDVMVASITQKMVTILNNQSTPGNFNFQKQTQTTTYINRHPKIGDLDTDGRPDLIFTSIDDKNLGIPASKVSVFLNKNCVVPKLSPIGPMTICNGFTQRITASDNAGASYEWFKDGSTLGAPGPNSFFDVTTQGAYTVKLTNGSCVKTSSPVQINVIVGAPLGPATPAAVAPVCVGGTLNLSVNDVGASDYVWTGPGSFIGHGAAVARPNFQPGQAGKYTVEVMVGTCITQRLNVVVDVVDIPDVVVQFSGSDIICSGQTKKFSIFPTVSGYTYQWADLTTGDISGETSSSFIADVTGKYLVKLKSTANPSCPPIQTAPKKVRIAIVPSVDFSLPSNGCVGQPVSFTNQSTVDIDPEDTEIDYTWDFGDAGTATTKDASHTYATAQSYSVKLTITYRNQSCPASKTKALLVQSLPTAAITNPSNLFTFCPSDSLLLQVLGAFDSYAWSTGGTSSSIYVKQGGNFSVDVTANGCKTTASKTVSMLNAPSVTASADPTSIKVGGTSQLSATGLSNFLWRPNNNLTDSLIANPKASPVLTTTYTVSGKDTNGCKGSATVEVIVIQDQAMNTLHPTQFFSPNADGINDVWQVENAPALNQCSIAIYDEKGIKIFEAKPYLNNWDGTSSHGKILPAGVYYYVIKCDDSPSNFLAGSINIVR